MLGANSRIAVRIMPELRRESKISGAEQKNRILKPVNV